MAREGFLLSRPIESVEEWLASGMGGVALERARQLGPRATTEEIASAGLRGRGGGGFPTGRKWSSVLGGPSPRYVVCNAAEGEPGTFKDRSLLRGNPYQVVEGLLVAASAMGTNQAFIALKASFTREIEVVERAVREFQEAGLSRDVIVHVVQGPEDYLFGEEKAMLEVIEGNAPLPRLLPPYEHGLFVGAVGAADPHPTLVNNVETLANVTHILANGSGWFREFGTAASPGTVVCTVSGDVPFAGVAEFEMGVALGEVIETIGGGRADLHTVRAVLAGVANGVLTGGDLSVPVSYEAMQAVGSGLGSAGFVVYDHSACIVEVARQAAQYLAAESCGQCLACKLGNAEISAHLLSIERGQFDEQAILELQSSLRRVTDANRCYLPVQAQTLVRSVLERFADDVAAHADNGCPWPRPVTFPKIIDIVGGAAILGESQDREQPDGTYAATAGWVEPDRSLGPL